MKRIGLLILMFLVFAFSLQAQNNGNGKFDDKLKQESNNSKNGDSKAKAKKVRVIIQTRTAITVNTKIAAVQGKVLKNFYGLPFVAVEVQAQNLDELANDPSVLKMSIDAPVKGSTIDGTEEPPNSSSGGVAAFNRWAGTGQGVGVAIIDSGIANHPDLNNVVYSADFTGAVPGSGDGFGHGTHVAGIVAGSGQSSGGMYAGIAPQSRLVNLRALDNNGAGYTSDVIHAIDWAIQNRNAAGNDGQPLNIRVINLSLGHQPFESASTDPLAVACRMATQAGIVVVVSAGNYGRGALGKTVYGGITSPGFEPSVITVGAVTTWGTPSRSDDTVASYSSRGPTRDSFLKPDITAPGSRMVAAMSPGNALVTQHPELQFDSNYMKLSGTSMAAPVITGAAAMILSKVPTLTPNAVKAILMFTAEKRATLGPLDWGAGYVNIAGAMDLAMSIDTTVAVGQNWLKLGTLLPMFDIINGYSAVWSQTIVWGDTSYSGTSIYYNKNQWATTIVWGDTIVWTETIVWGETIVWETNLAAQSTVVAGQTIVWDDLLAQTIVWDQL